MNKDEIISLVTKILLMVLTPIAAKQHVDGNTLTAIVTDVVDAVVLGYSIYAHWNMKKVPETAAVTLAPPVTK